MAAIVIHSGGLRPLDGSVQTSWKVAAEAIDHDRPALTLNSDDTVEEAGASGPCFGLYIGNERKEVDAASGDTVGAVTFGRVAGFVGMTPSAVLYLAANGGLADTGTVAVGYAESDQVAMFMPGVTNAGSPAE